MLPLNPSSNQHSHTFANFFTSIPDCIACNRFSGNMCINPLDVRMPDRKGPHKAMLWPQGAPDQLSLMYAIRVFCRRPINAWAQRSHSMQRLQCPTLMVANPPNWAASKWLPPTLVLAIPSPKLKSKRLTSPVTSPDEAKNNSSTTAAGLESQPWAARMLWSFKDDFHAFASALRRWLRLESQLPCTALPASTQGPMRRLGVGQKLRKVLGGIKSCDCES